MAPLGNRRFQIAPLALFLLSLAAIWAASYFPDSRLWGINSWQFFPPLLRLATLGSLAVLGIAVWLLFAERKSLDPARSDWVRPAVLCASAILTLCFIFFRNQVHFLGDGYQLLATLPSDQPYLKSRNFGGMMLPYLIMQLLGEPTKATALLAYQIVSITFGVIFLALAYVVARFVTPNRLYQLLLWLGLCTGGYMLLYFGYVENYAPRPVAVLLFCLVGLAVEKHSLSRWWLIPAYLLTVFFHVFGVVLLPAAVYQFMKGSPENSLLKSRPLRVAIWGGGTVVALALFIHLAHSYLFFRFAFISAITTRFTVAGYTLLSSAHIADWLILVLTITPGSILFLVLLRPFWRSVRSDAAGLRFLLVTSACLLALAFIVDPGLGMPRDWDLFASAGVPLSLLLFSGLFTLQTARAVAVGALCISLNLSLLIPRVATAAAPDAGFQMAESYVRLDPHKCLTYSYLVVERVRDQYGLDSALALQDRWSFLFPDDRQLDTGLTLLAAGQFAEAHPYFQRATELNAMNYSAWANLGRTFLETSRYDSAIAALRIATGINPYSSTITSNYAWALYYAGRHRDAEQYWLKARKLDTANVIALTGLATLYSADNDPLLYAAYFDSIIHRPDMPVEYLLPAAEYFCSRSEFSAAAGMLSKASESGLDPASIELLVERYPELRAYWEAIRHSSSRP